MQSPIFKPQSGTRAVFPGGSGKLTSTRPFKRADHSEQGFFISAVLTCGEAVGCSALLSKGLNTYMSVGGQL